MKEKSDEMKSALSQLLPRMGVEVAEEHYKAARLSSPLGLARLVWKGARGVWIVKEVGVKKGTTYATSESAAGAISDFLSVVRDHAIRAIAQKSEEAEEEAHGEASEEATSPEADQGAGGEVRAGSFTAPDTSEDDHQGTAGKGEDAP